MTDAEFTDWLDHHLCCFPELRGWLKRNTPEGTPEEKRPVQAWKRVLIGLPVGAAKEASDAILAGDVSVRGFGQHPAAVVEFCRQRTIHHCDDLSGDRFPPCVCTHGYLDILPVNGGYGDVVLCTCPRGDHREECHRKIGATPMRRFREGDVLESDG